MLRGTPRLSDILRLLRRAEALELSAQAVQRLKWYAYACEHGWNVSLTCRHFGISRSTFLRWAGRFDPCDPRTLEEQSRRPHTVRTPETEEAVVRLVTQLRTEHPGMGKAGIQKLLHESFGVTVSVSTVGRIISRHTLFFADKASHEQKRRAAADVPDEEPTQRSPSCCWRRSRRWSGS